MDDTKVAEVEALYHRVVALKKTPGLEVSSIHLISTFSKSRI